MTTEWQTRFEERDGARAQRVVVSRNGDPITYAEAVAGWRDDAAFRAFFCAVLADAQYAAYFWETPPVTEATFDRGFEFAVIDSPALARVRPEPAAFAEHFGGADADADVVAFPNLGRDAQLVAPCPRTDHTAYPHLAAFSRQAPEPQQHAFWQCVAAELERALGPSPVWLSTSGLGVYWLHARLDSFPKYYQFGPYRDAE